MGKETEKVAEGRGKLARELKIEGMIRDRPLYGVGTTVKLC